MSGRRETRFTRSGDVDIAYQVIGDGERDVLFIPGCLGPILPAVQAPTLILHRKDVPLFDLESVRAGAARMPPARCVELPGTDALVFVGDSDAVLAEIEEFLTGRHQTADSNRTVATVLFTDIVASTEKAEAVGDLRWRYLLDDHHHRVRRLLERFRGVEVDTAGDGFFATFDGPARVVLVLDGVFDVRVDGHVVGRVGPGTVVGERAPLEGGRRTADLRATTEARIAEVPAGSLDLDLLSEPAHGHHREGS